ncbi:mannosyltransferase [Actinomortierella ambigua]|nr:mannosyltransferase [Actinomortierella ambigua]
MDAEAIGFDSGNLRAAAFGLTFMVLFRFIGYLATKAPKVSHLGKPGLCLVVLGDIGRSPRMLLHARSALDAGYRVDIVGYKGSPPPDDLVNNQSMQFYYLKELPRVPEGMPKIVYYLWAPIKAFLLGWNLFYATMFGVAAPDVYVVQNPPSVPTLHVLQIVNWLRQRHLVIDWHNYGASIVAQRLGQKSIFAKFVRIYEKVWGFKATIHITVSRAMARDLLYNQEKRGKVTTLYDRAPESFRRLNVDEIHEFMDRIKLEKLVREQSLNSSFLPTISAQQTLFTEKKTADGPATFRADRPALIVSSTSWTEEEDFSLLLEAAKQYDNMAKGNGKEFAKLLFVITGKGPMKQHYEEEISKMNFEHVVIVTAWMANEDYPLLLGSADLGVCLHKSTSGMDLPMKIVDMFGCGLPVCAFKYEALSELVQAKSNGLVFEDATDLRLQLVGLFKGFVADDPNQQVQLEKMRDVIKNGFQRVRWSENWNMVMWPLLRNLDKTWADAQVFAENPKFSINPRLVMHEDYDIDDGLYDDADYEQVEEVQE